VAVCIWLFSRRLPGIVCQSAVTSSIFRSANARSTISSAPTFFKGRGELGAQRDRAPYALTSYIRLRRSTESINGTSEPELILVSVALSD
jgi:hypothetical protein